LPETAGCVFDVVRVGFRRDLHADPAAVGLPRVLSFGAVTL